MRLPLEHWDSPHNTDSTGPAAARKIAAQAQARWGREVRVFRAPGRVNLIGEHTDYNDGFVLPAAIEFSTWVAASLRTDRRLVVYSENFNEGCDFDPEHPPQTPRRHWSNYVAGVVAGLRHAGVAVPAADLLIHGEVPIGAGLSSSAALETVVAFTLCSLADVVPDRRELALLCQKAEQEFAGVRVGIMDPFISAHAKAGRALLLDCRSLDYRLESLPEGVSIAICNTMVHHDLAASAYNERRAECEAGVELLARRLPEVRALRDVTSAELERCGGDLDPVVYRRCRHVVTENSRVLQAAEALRERDLARFGKLMCESHRSLRDDYEVSCPELDVMTEIAGGLPGVYGARMTGGGFGGCTVNLVRNEDEGNFRKEVSARYFEATGRRPEIYITDAAEGVEEVLQRGDTR
jgi:galactokinase